MKQMMSEESIIHHNDQDELSYIEKGSFDADFT